MGEEVPSVFDCGRGVLLRPDWHTVLAPVFSRPIPGDAVARMAALWRSSGGGDDPRLRRVDEVLSDRFRTDVARYSGVFEPSFSFDRDGWHCIRFSYAFPDFREAPDAVCKTILDAARPFGAPLTTHVSRLLRWCFQPFIEQPITGLAYDGPESWTFKIYYQVDLRFQDQAVQWLARLIPWGSLRWILGGGGPPLHLIGLDVGPSGIRTVKLYLLHQDVETARLAGLLLPRGMANHLVEQGVLRLCNLLTVHRMRSPDDPGVRRVSEVDFPLIENGLYNMALFGDAGLLHAYLPGLSAPPMCSKASTRLLWPSGLDGTRLLVVRLTVSATREPKLNLYFHVVEKAADD